MRRRPILRYPGGKWKLAKDFVIPHLPRHRTYTEPYAGGASILLQKEPSYAEIYNDLDQEVVNVFRVMRDRDKAKELCYQLNLTPFSREEFCAAYGENPNVDLCIGCGAPYSKCGPPLWNQQKVCCPDCSHRVPSDIEKARRTIVKSFMGYGASAIHDDKPHGMRTSSSLWVPPTGFRPDSNKSGTTPAHDWATYPRHIQWFCERLQKVVIENRPAIDIILQHDRSTTLHYCDPPYVHRTRKDSRRRTREGVEVYRYEMKDEDHVKLATVLHEVEGMVVLSGYSSELYDELYRGWKCVTRDTFADGARPRTEALWLSQSTVRVLEEQGSLF